MPDGLDCYSPSELVQIADMDCGKPVLHDPNTGMVIGKTKSPGDRTDQLLGMILYTLLEIKRQK